MHKVFYEKNIGNNTLIYDEQIDIIKFSHTEKIEDHYSRERLAQVAPYKTDISITKKCNQNCINCFATCIPSELGSEMSYSDLVNKIEERKNNIIRLMITGGEPFMHSDIDEILKLPQLFQNLKFVVCSNGTRITESHIALLNNYDWLTILSIHGCLTTHSNYTQCFNSYSMAVKSLEKLFSVGARVKIYSVINEFSTTTDIDHLFELKEKYKVGAIKFMTPRRFGRYEVNHNKSIVEYVKSRLGRESGLQETSSKTELITFTGAITVTD